MIPLIKTYEQLSTGGSSEEYGDESELEGLSQEDIDSVSKSLEAIGVTHFKLWKGKEDQNTGKPYIAEGRAIIMGNKQVGTHYTLKEYQKYLERISKESN